MAKKIGKVRTNKIVLWDKNCPANSIKEISSLPLPWDNPTIKKMDLPSLEEECQAAISFIYILMTGKIERSDLEKLSNSSESTPSEEHIVNYMVKALASALHYYDFFLTELLAQEFNLTKEWSGKKRKHTVPPGMQLDYSTQIVKHARTIFEKNNVDAFHVKKPLTIDTFHVTFNVEVVHYLFFKQSIYYFVKLGGVPVSSAAFETSFHENLVKVFSQSQNNIRTEMKDFFSAACGTGLKLIAEFYAARETWDKEHRPALFSAIKISELSGIASRSAAMVKKYGEKRLEKIFETQISLLMQSFGFYVSAANIGKRVVDLVCISHDPRSPATIIIDAKSTGKPYSLPSSDARALTEYISDVQTKLTSLPTLKMAIIVGPSPSKTLLQKIKALQAKASIPIRFISARDLANFREQHLSPLIISDFLEEILSGEIFISEAVLNKISKRSKSKEEAINKFIQAFMDNK